jgi:glutaredoxin 3
MQVTLPPDNVLVKQSVNHETDAFNDVKSKYNFKTVPRIFINDKHTEEYDKLIDLEKERKLDGMLNNDESHTDVNPWKLRIQTRLQDRPSHPEGNTKIRNDQPEISRKTSDMTKRLHIFQKAETELSRTESSETPYPFGPRNYGSR